MKKIKWGRIGLVILWVVLLTGILFLFVESRAGAEHIFWDYSRNDYITVPENPCRLNLLNDETRALQELYPEYVKPRPVPCPWTHMSVPEYEVDAYYKLGWEPMCRFEKEMVNESVGTLVVDEKGKQVSFTPMKWNQTFIFIRKRICQEGK